MSHDGNHHRPGARPRVSELDTPARSAVPGRRTLTEALASQPVVEPTPGAVQRQAGDAAHGEPAQAPASPVVAPPASPFAGPLFPPHVVQMLEASLGAEVMAKHLRAYEASKAPAGVHAAAAGGISGTATQIPHLEPIQRAFGRHDVSHIQAHVGGPATDGARAMGAEAFATSNHVAFASSPSLHTASHEAAHVVQQRAGVQLKGGVGAVGDAYERHADQVADAVVAGKSAEALLEQMPGGGQRGPTVQRNEKTPSRPTTGADPDITPPVGGIDKTGFIDSSDGAFIRTGPREAGGTPVRAAPLPPATRVFATGRHPAAPEWLYVTAFPAHEIVRGYVQGLRVNFHLPEPLAELRQLRGGETVEKLAKEKFGQAVSDGHDHRYYENVLLYVNKGRAGISGTYQDPGVLGGGANNIQLTAGHRIWLVSAEFAKTLESIVPSGSLTGGAIAKARRFAGHVQDILHSVTESRRYLGEVAGEYAQAIREHQNAIFGIVGIFLAAEATSALLAATPTGVTQIIAVLIQLTLSALGAAGMVEAGAAAMQHGAAWLSTAWTANGKPEKLTDASREFIKMLVGIAMAALSYLGAKGNYGNAVKIANTMPTGGLPALALVGGGQMGAGAGTRVLIGPDTRSLGVGGAMMSKLEGDGGNTEPASTHEQEPKRTTHSDPQSEAERSQQDASEVTQYERTTRKDARVENRTTDIARSTFEANLEEAGFSKTVTKDGKATIFERNGERYIVRDHADSTGGPTADHYPPGSIKPNVKIRLN